MTRLQTPQDIPTERERVGPDGEDFTGVARRELPRHGAHEGVVEHQEGLRGHGRRPPGFAIGLHLRLVEGLEDRQRLGAAELHV